MPKKANQGATKTAYLDSITGDRLSSPNLDKKGNADTFSEAHFKSTSHNAADNPDAEKIAKRSNTDDFTKEMTLSQNSANHNPTTKKQMSQNAHLFDINAKTLAGMKCWEFADRRRCKFYKQVGVRAAKG